MISRAGKLFVELGHGFDARRLVVSTRGAQGRAGRYTVEAQESFGKVRVLLEGVRGGVCGLRESGARREEHAPGKRTCPEEAGL